MHDTDTPAASATTEAPPWLGTPVAGVPHTIGEGFTALHFSEEMFRGRMDPLLMVDHFTMTAPTFDPHLHAGISAVTLMFEDSAGGFVNRDTLGNHLVLQPGDLYWLAAAGGAVHEEKPEPGARIHALQIFVNLPARLKGGPARSLLVRAQDVPVLAGEGHRVRLLLGASGGLQGAVDTPEPLTMLDGFLEPGGAFSHALEEGQQAWVYAAAGPLTVRRDGESRLLPEGRALGSRPGPGGALALSATKAAHFVLLAGRPLREPFVKYGPLVMSTAADVRQTLENHARGQYGHV